MIQTHCGILYYNTLGTKLISLEQIVDIFKNLNHRGRDCSGIIIPISSRDTPYILKKEGLVSKDKYTNIELKLHTNEVLCHNRYATSGGDTNLIKYCQPFYSKNRLGEYWIAFNGNIPASVWNKFYINEDFANEENDTIKLIMYINNISSINTIYSWNDLLKVLLEEIECAYSIVIMTPEHTYFFKDRYNFKPLCYSLYNIKNDLYNNHLIITSESNILESEYFSDTNNDSNDITNSNDINDSNDNDEKNCKNDDKTRIMKNKVNFKYVEPGIIYDFNKKIKKIIRIKPTSYKENMSNMKCSFEQIYFMREKSLTFSEFKKTGEDNMVSKFMRTFTFSTEKSDTHKYKETVEDVRFNLGQELYLNMKTEHRHLVDMLKMKNALVCGVPHSGIAYGEGFCNLSEFQYKQIIKKNISGGMNTGERTFILENQAKRVSASEQKYIYDYTDEDINRPLIVIDDSVVRGTTASKLLNDLKEIGFKIYFLSGSPPVCNECNYGVNMGSRDNLLINKKQKTELADYYGIEFMMYNTKKSLNLVIGDCCTQCLSPDNELF
jgi:glutamine phosphoribosylpyrophosphate amidotransferase